MDGLRLLLTEGAKSQLDVEKVRNLEETEVNNISQRNLSQLYKTVVDKREKLDYGKIPDSKGRITKYDNYQHIKDVISTIDNILADVGVNSSNFNELNNIKQAMYNLEENEINIAKAYDDGDNVIGMIYDNVVYSIVMGISTIIAVVVEFVKNSDNEFESTIKDVKDVSKDKWGLLSALERFNKLVADGKLRDLLKEYDRNEDEIKKVTESPVTIGSTLLVITLFVLSIREMVFRFYYVKQKLSVQLKKQADFIEMNEYKIRRSDTLPEKKKKKVIKKQNKIAKRLIKWSNKLGVKIAKSEQKSKEELHKTKPENVLI